MDANQQRFWLIAAPEKFRLSGTGAEWDAGRRVLRLASRRRIEGLSDDRAAARAASDAPPMAIDPFGTWARVLDGRHLVVGGVAEPELPLELEMLQADEQIADLALAANGILYLALRQTSGAGRVLLVDRRERFVPVAIELAGFSADRLAVAADGRIWALDRAAGRLALIKGEPLPRLAERAFAPDSFRPSEENLDPPRLELLPEVDFAPGRQILACAADERGLVVLLWPVDGPSELQRIEHGRALPPVAVEGVPAAFDVGWLGGDRFALLVADENEALAIALPDGEPPASAAPLGDRYPLVAWQPRPLRQRLHHPCALPVGRGGRAPAATAAPALAAEHGAPRAACRSSRSMAALGAWSGTGSTSRPCCRPAAGCGSGWPLRIPARRSTICRTRLFIRMISAACRPCQATSRAASGWTRHPSWRSTTASWTARGRAIAPACSPA